MSIEEYRRSIEAEIVLFVQKMGEQNRLRDACEYALTNGGKRLRPILVLMIAHALGQNKCVMAAALSVEFFHTASLIADDLPCMDNDDTRRDKPSLHKVFGENLAILASYALIAEGYGGIHRNGADNPTAVALCLETATRCAGIQGATNGQFLDLYPPKRDLDTIRTVIYQKTITLFEICFTFGWLFGGGKSDQLPTVQKCAYHLGMAFQIADDLGDTCQDEARKNSVNIVEVCGRELAYQMFSDEMTLFSQKIKSLGLYTKDFQDVIAWLWELSRAVYV